MKRAELVGLESKDSILQDYPENAALQKEASTVRS